MEGREWRINQHLDRFLVMNIVLSHMNRISTEIKMMTKWHALLMTSQIGGMWKKLEGYYHPEKQLKS